MNPIDSFVGWFNPEAGYKRKVFRGKLRGSSEGSETGFRINRNYEASQTNNFRSAFRDRGSADTLLERSAEVMRDEARALERNYDFISGVLDILVARIVGSKFFPEPQVRMMNGELATDLNLKLAELFEEWSHSPEVTGEYNFVRMIQLMVRSWCRDGEVFAKSVIGNVKALDMGVIKLKYEILEADFCPWLLVDFEKGIFHGVEKNKWRKPTGYRFLREHPGEFHRVNRASGVSSFGFVTDRVAADKVIHLKTVKRFWQTRGETVFASVLNRVRDMKDIEDAERIAARAAARITGYIFTEANNDSSFDIDEESKDHELEQGAYFSGLGPGQEPRFLETNRPSPILEAYRHTQERGLAAGSGTGYSELSHDYSQGSYSAQRQELVNQDAIYAITRGIVKSVVYKPMWGDFVTAAITNSAQTNIDITGVDEATLFNAHYQEPVIPWIDPEKQAKANVLLVNMQSKSVTQVIRDQGENPAVVFAMIKKEQKDNGIKPATQTPAPQTQEGEPEPKPDEEDGEDRDDDDTESESESENTDRRLSRIRA